jgi:membrane protease YdiL (CAAX protease family)
MMWLPAAGLGALVATGAVLLAVVFGLAAVERSKTLRAGALLGQVLLLVLSAAIEEALFRVLLIGALTVIAPDAVAVVLSAVLFGLPHVVRGSNNEEQRANAITAAAFGLVVGAMWVSQRDFGAIVAFHAAFNIVAGLVLGAGAVDPLNERLPKVTWPLAMRDLGQRTGAALLWLTALSELIPLAAVALLLRPSGLL